MRRRNFYSVLVTILLSSVILLVATSPALAWPNTTQVQFSFFRYNLTGADVDDATTDFTASQVWPTQGNQFAPGVVGQWSNRFPSSTSAVVGDLRRILYWGATIPSPGPGESGYGFGAWHNALFTVPPGGGVTVIYGTHQWTLQGIPVGSPVGMGWRAASPPAIIVLPDKPGIIVKSLRFANSHSAISVENLTLDGTAGLSWDSPRPDITVSPGEAVEVQMPGILDPVAGGRTVVAKGIVWQNGEEMTFLTQWAIPPVPVTGANTYWLATLGLLAIAMGLALMKRTKFLRI